MNKHAAAFMIAPVVFVVIGNIAKLIDPKLEKTPVRIVTMLAMLIATKAGAEGIVALSDPWKRPV